MKTRDEKKNVAIRVSEIRKLVDAVPNPPPPPPDSSFFNGRVKERICPNSSKASKRLRRLLGMCREKGNLSTGEKALFLLQNCWSYMR